MTAGIKPCCRSFWAFRVPRPSRGCVESVTDSAMIFLGCPAQTKGNTPGWGVPVFVTAIEEDIISIRTAGCKGWGRKNVAFWIVGLTLRVRVAFLTRSVRPAIQTLRRPRSDHHVRGLS